MRSQNDSDLGTMAEARGSRIRLRTRKKRVDLEFETEAGSRELPKAISEGRSQVTCRASLRLKNAGLESTNGVPLPVL